jgi:hypothetical protein
VGQYATRVTRESETRMILIMPAHTVLGDPGDYILYIMYYTLYVIDNYILCIIYCMLFLISNISNILYIIYYVGGGSLINITCFKTQHLTFHPQAGPYLGP